MMELKDQQIEALKHIIRLQNKRWLELVEARPPVVSGWDLPDDSALDEAIEAYEQQYGAIGGWREV